MTADIAPELQVYDEILDAEHADLLQGIADAARALHASRSVLDGAIAMLGDRLVEHLAREERRMDASEYPERVRHRLAHELFMADFARMRATLAASGPRDPLVVEWLETRLPAWLRFHIRVNDAPLAAWLAHRGARGEPQLEVGRNRLS